MSPNIRRKLEALAERHEELGLMLADPAAANDNKRFRELSQEYAQLEPVTRALADFDSARRDLAAAEALRSDPEMRDLAEEEIDKQHERLGRLDHELSLLLLPRDPRDDANIFLEIRAGTGGDEAALFAGDLFRMYTRYAEQQGWRVEVLSASEGEHGGYKEIISRIVGSSALSTRRTPVTRFRRSIRSWMCAMSLASTVLPRMSMRTSGASFFSRRAAAAALTCSPYGVSRSAGVVRSTNVRMPPDFYHLCITEHPNDSRAFWQCAVDMDLASRGQIGEAGFKRLEVCRRTLSNLDPSREHSLMLQVDGQEFECTGRPPPATAPARK